MRRWTAYTDWAVLTKDGTKPAGAVIGAKDQPLMHDLYVANVIDGKFSGAF